MVTSRPLKLPDRNQINEENLVENFKKLIGVVSELADVQNSRDQNNRDMSILNAIQDSNQHLGNVENRLGEVEETLVKVDGRLENLETAQDETNQQLTKVNERLENLETSQKETNQHLTKINGRLENLEASQNEMVSLLKIIAKNTARKSL